MKKENALSQMTQGIVFLQGSCPASELNGIGRSEPESLNRKA